MSSAESSWEIAAEQEMRRLKLEAIDKGEVTDYSFKVGPDEAKTEVSSFYFLLLEPRLS